MDAFFVLSGFLITSLLLQEYARTGEIARFAFYVRRVRRLLPALLILVVGVGVIYTIVPSLNTGLGYLTSAIAVLFYAANWVEAFTSRVAEGDLGLLSHAWSLAIEEQFYILWPPLLIVCLRLRWRPTALLRMLVALAIASASLRVATWEGWLGGSAYFRADTRADDLLIGCALGVIWRSRLGSEWLARHAARRWVPVAAVASCGAALVKSSPHSSFLYLGGFSFLALAVAAGIAHIVVAPEGVFGRITSAKPFVWTGVRSYGIYLYHLPIFTLIGRPRIDLPDSTLFPIRVAATMLVAAASYRFVEIHFLRQKPYPGAPTPVSGLASEAPPKGPEPASKVDS